MLLLSSKCPRPPGRRENTVRELIAGGIWKGDILIADVEDLEMMDASDIYFRRIKAKEVLIRQKDDEFVFPFADGTAKLSGRDYEFRVPTLRREQPVSTSRAPRRHSKRRPGLVCVPDDC